MRARITCVAATAFMAAGVIAGTVPAYKYDLRTPKNCNWWLDNDGDWPCKTIPTLAEITQEQYLAWNPSLDPETCTPFNVQQSYCVGVCEKDCASASYTASATTPTPPKTSTSTSGPVMATPSPVQNGTAKECTTFTLVTKGSTCRDIANQYGLLVSQLVSYNTAFKDDCSGLLPGYYACVGLRKLTQTSPGTPAPTPLPSDSPFYDNFEKGNMDRWNVYDGTYDAKSKALVASSSPGGTALLNTSFADFIFEADITLPKENDGHFSNAGLVFRASHSGSSADNYYGYYAGVGTDGFVVLSRADNGWTQLDNVKADVQPNRTLHMMVRATGDLLAVYVDDMSRPKIGVKDATYVSGMDGVRVYQTGATFDNIKISPMVFSDDFSTGDMDSWTVYDGAYSAGSKALVAVSSPGGKALLNTRFADFTFEADITLENSGSGSAGLVFRVSYPDSGADNYSGYYAGIGAGSVVLGRADGKWKELKSVPAHIRAGTVFHMLVRASGDQLDIYVDSMSRPVISLRDATFARGLNGVRVYQTGASFDNAKIYRI